MADNEELDPNEALEPLEGEEATDAEVEFVEPREVVEKGECEPCPSMAPAWICLLYTSPSPRDLARSRMPSSA